MTVTGGINLRSLHYQRAAGGVTCVGVDCINVCPDEVLYLIFVVRRVAAAQAAGNALFIVRMRGLMRHPASELKTAALAAAAALAYHEQPRAEIAGRAWQAKRARRMDSLSA